MQDENTTPAAEQAESAKPKRKTAKKAAKKAAKKTAKKK